MFELLGRELLERLFQIVRLLGFENHDIPGRMGGAVFPQGEINSVFLGAGPKQSDVGIGDFNIGQGATALFELPQALSALVGVTLGCLTGSQKFLHGRLQYLAGELACLNR
ncbi:Uncharacterised protein [Enterocloster clostridioformis]|uniref:Uncharacterized protein n=1 Tax=Enterocloster clostridioformis TaxID=1531 RepID=A0A2X2WKW1_9FIRM|nr:Uncharacterised protein [Enterocloster clostridioformis]